MESLKQIAQNIIHGQFQDTKSLVQHALAGGLTPDAILNEGLFAGMEVVGQRFRDEEMYIPEVMLAARAMQNGIDILAPLWGAEGGKDKGKIIFGTVKGDIHNLGKKLVTIMLRGVGFQVIDIGENVVADRFISSAIEENATIIAMSALLTTTMGYMQTVIEELEKKSLRGTIKTLVGGACVTQRFADEIGADGFAENAGHAVAKAKDLMAAP